MVTIDLATEISKRSFEYFCKIMLKQKLGRIHREWIESVLRTDKHTVLMAPRGHFKTSILSVSFPLWIMFREKKPKIFVILSATLDQSSEIMRMIKSKIEETPALSEVLEPENKHSTKWTETEIETKNKHRVICSPLNDSVRGKHPNYFILDDILKGEVATDVETTKRVFYSVVFPAAQAKRGKLIVVGTPISFVDLLNELSQPDKSQDFDFHRYSAVVFNPDGSWKEPVFPEHFSIEQLQAIRRTMPAHLFAREYMCEPISGESSAFPPEVIQSSVKLHEDLKKIYETTPGVQWYMGCDIAVSQSERADWSVFTTIGKLPDQPFFVKDVCRKHLDSTANVTEIQRLYNIHKHNRILIEQNGVGWGPAEACTKADSPIRSVSIMFDTRAASKEKILSRLEVTMRNKSLAIPNNDVLITELSQVSYKGSNNGKNSYESKGEHDDTVMSLAIALEAASRSSYASMALV